MPAESSSQLTVVPRGDWDQRIVVCRSTLMDGMTVDTHIVTTERYVVMIDTVHNPATARALLAVAEPALHDGRRLLVVNTHADWDHAWGNQLFAGDHAEYPAPIIATRHCAERLQGTDSAATLARFRDQYPSLFDQVKLTPPTIWFDHQLVIDGGDLVLHLFATPGHTADHLSVAIPAINTLFPGDAAEDPFPFPHGAAGLPDLRASLHALAATGATTVLCCHAPVTAGSRLLATNIGYFDRLEAHCRAALAHGVNPDVDDAKLAQAVNFPLSVALPPDTDVAALHQMYQTGHIEAIRAMLNWLSHSTEQSS